MKRLTQKSDCECKANNCRAEEWILKVVGIDYDEWEGENVCDHCPFMKYINVLAEYENKAEKEEDDLR